MEMEATHHQFQIQKPIPTLQKIETTKTHKRSQMGSHSFSRLKGHSSSFCRKQRTRKRQRKEVMIKEDDDEEEEEGVGDKIMALQRIVPGGEDLGADKLFEETADYILALQTQVKALRALTSFFEGLQKEKRKLGG